MRVIYGFCKTVGATIFGSLAQPTAPLTLMRGPSPDRLPALSYSAAWLHGVHRRRGRTTDIIFLEKRAPGALAKGEAWLELAPHGTQEDGQFFINEYFVRHPEMMLGRMAYEGTMYRRSEPALAGDLTPDMLSRAVATLPAGIMARRARTPHTISDVRGCLRREGWRLCSARRNNLHAQRR